MAFQKAKAVAEAQGHIHRGQYRKAIALYQRIVKNDPDDVRAQLKLGDLFIKVADRQNATTVLRVVADHYAEQGSTLKAVAVYKQILRIYPELPEVAAVLAKHYQQLGLINDAIIQYKAAARLFARQGRLKERLDAVKQMLDLDPENVLDRIRAAEEFSINGRIKEAADLFRSVCEILQERERFDIYRPVAERLLYHAPQDIEANKVLAGQYLQDRDAARALPRLRVCFQASQEDLDVLDMLQQAFDLLGQPHKAITVLKEMARLYDRNGLTEERDQIYEQILILDGEDPSARAALSLTSTPEEERLSEFEFEADDTALPPAATDEFVERDDETREATPSEGSEKKSGQFPPRLVADEGPDNLETLDLDAELQIDEEGEVTVVSKVDNQTLEDFRALEEEIDADLQTRSETKPAESSPAEPIPAIAAKKPPRKRPAEEIDETAFATDEEVDLDQLMKKLADGSADETVEAAAPAEAPPAPAVAAPSEKKAQGFDASLQEVDFYITNELEDDALLLLEELEKDYPNHPAIIQRIEKLTAS